MHKELSLALTELKPYINSFENSMKPDMYSIKNSVDPDQLASSEFIKHFFFKSSLEKKQPADNKKVCRITQLAFRAKV